MGRVEELRGQLKQLIVKRLRLNGIEPASLSDDAPLLKGPLGLDSIDILEVALAVEEAYGLKIDDEALGQAAFGSISALADFIEQNRTSEGPVE